jgi:hypothetical protein
MFTDHPFRQFIPELFDQARSESIQAHITLYRTQNNVQSFGIIKGMVSEVCKLRPQNGLIELWASEKGYAECRNCLALGYPCRKREAPNSVQCLQCTEGSGELLPCNRVALFNTWILEGIFDITHGLATLLVKLVRRCLYFSVLLS